MTDQEQPTSYSFANAWHAARERLWAIEAWLDPGTIRHLLACGVIEGWHCLEVAAGGGSIATWLCQQVGEKGHVLAIDIDPRFLEHIDLPSLEVRRHNLITDELEQGCFDLVHARLILAHLPNRKQVLQQLCAALKPGGVLVVEEMDFASVACAASDPVSTALFERMVAAHHQVMNSRGFDLFYGRKLKSFFQEQGLVDIGTEGRASVMSGGSAQAVAWQLTFAQLQEELLATGALTLSEIKQGFALLQTSTFTFLSQLAIAAWGRRPATEQG
jgi:2-polyprenyl-3-methyl-5-hydroxy-6-metoxy-1,4-benzoquinol methylase